MSKRRGLIERFRGRRPASSRTVRPTGTVTFVLTDVEGSTRLWETQPDAMERAILRHGEIVAGAVERRRGTLIRERGEGDSTFSVFPRAPDAIAAAFEMQRALSHEPWETGAELRVRIAMHTGDAYLISDDEYASPVINRCARIREVAFGGQVLISDHTVQLAESDLPDGATVLDLGPHRLRDLSRPVRVYQLQHPDLPQTFPRLRSLEAGLHNLPVQLTSFIGRDREVAEVRKHLASTRVLNLVGPGGIGKTRLALQAAGDLADAYPDGIWFVDLAPVSDAAMVPQALATALSLREERERPVTESVIEHLRSADALIALDNCEHLIDAASEFATELLRSCVELSILATGREALRVPGATTWRVPALAVPDDTVPTEALGTYESIRLFTERAGLVRPDFALSHDTGPIVASICRKLDGVPLAIELAAANVGAMSVADIEARLDDRFRTLTRGGPDHPRHGTLRATVDWSHDLLGERERVLFRRLSVFVGGFTLEGAEDVCSAEPLVRDEIVTLLTRLVDKSLVVLDDVLDTTRYAMLETIREFAALKLAESDEEVTTRDRHAAYVRTFAERVAEVLEGADETQHHKVLETELPNVRVALQHLKGSAPEEALALAATLVHFWGSRGFQSEGLTHIADGLERIDGLEPQLEASACVAIGTLNFQLGRLSDALASHERAVELRRESADDPRISEALIELANVVHATGDVPRAEDLYTEALDRAQRSGALRQVAGALNGLGIIALSTGRTTEAIATYEEMITVTRRLQTRRGTGTALANLGLALIDVGQTARGVAQIEEALSIARELGDVRFIAIQLGSLAGVAADSNDLDRARRLHDEALSLYREVGDAVGEAYAQYGLGEVARMAGDLGDAEEKLRSALDLWNEAGHAPAGALARLALGLVARALGDPSLARDRLLEAAASLASVGRVDGLTLCVEALAGLILDTGDAVTAATIMLAAASASRERTGSTPPASDAAMIAADIASAKAAISEEAFATAWDEGTRTSLDDAIALGASTLR